MPPIGFSRRKIPRSSAYMISEKAIWFRHPDYNPVRAQKLISSSMSRHLSTRNISSKSMHAFLSNLATRQRDRQTNTGKKHLPPPLSEVKIVNEKPQIKVVGIKRLNIIIIRPIHAFIMRAHSVVILNQRRNHIV